MARGLTLGVLLAGGQSRRMGGGDKALRDFGGQPLISTVLARFAPQVPRLLINSPNPALDDFGYPRLIDRRTGHQGPLAGIESGLLALAPSENWLVTSPCDGPFLPLDFVTRLHAAAESSGARVVLARSNGRDHPVAGLWHRETLVTLSAFLDAGDRKVDLLTAQLDEARAEFDRIDDIDPFLNLNRPEDVTQAAAHLK